MMVGASAATYDDSSGDETPTVRAPWVQQPVSPNNNRPRPGLLNRWKPKDDDETPYENQGDNPAASRPRPGLLNRWKPNDCDNTPYENQKQISGKKLDGGDDKTEASFTSRNDLNPLGGSTRSGLNEGASTRSNMNAGSKRLLTAKHNDTELQEMMKDNLELMYEIVMRIREDEDYARSIYRDCPRLQHLLDQHPDLRPIFEDPNLVRINFEKVYRDAGGILPGDEKELNRFQKIMAYVVKHPLFKVFKVLLFIKKIVSCIMSGGAALLKTLFKSLFWTPDPTDVPGSGGAGLAGAGNAAAGTGAGPDAPDDQTADTGIDGSDPTSDLNANKIALNRAAEHMSDPQVQANMNDILQNDPDQLDDYIENDPELKALRDSNPLCAELMSDPETMKIMTDPDNLRALGEAPELISQDFADPNWTPPELDAPPDDLDDFEDADMNDPDMSFVNNGDGIDVDNGDYGQAGVAGYDHGTGSGTKGMGAGTGTDYATEAQDNVEEQGFEDFEFGDGTDQGFNGQNVGYDNIVGTSGEEDQFAEDFELEDSYNNNIGLYDNNGNNYVTGGDPNDAGQDAGDAIADFEFGDNNDNNMYNLHGDGQHFGGTVNDAGVGDDQDGYALEDFESGDDQQETGFTDTGADNAIIEDFELGEQDGVNGLSGGNHFDATTDDNANYTANNDNVDGSGDGGGNAIADFELGDVQEDDVDAGGDTTAPSLDDGHGLEAAPAGQQEKKKEQDAGPRSETSGGFVGGSIIAQVAAGMADVVMGELVGAGLDNVFGDAISANEPDMLDNMVENADYADEAVDAAEQNANDPNAASRNADKSRGGEGAEEEQQEQNEKQQEEPQAPTTKLGRIGNFLKATAVEQVFSAFVGEDFGEMLAERMIDGREQERKVDEGAEGAEEGNTEEKKGTSSGFFGGSKKQEEE